MSKALDRSQRAGSDPIQIGSTKLVTDSNNDLTVQDTSNNRKKILASEVHLGDSSNVVILKKGSDNNIQFQTQASGGSASSSNAGGTVVYATISAMTAVSASAGDQALVTANSGLYVHNGGGWYKVATINTSPTISSPSTGGSFVLAKDGTATTIELVGADVDEGTTLQNSYAVTTGSLTNGGGATAAVTTSSTSNGTYAALNPSTNTTNRFFKVTPTTNTSYAGSFSITFSVSDGINAATTIQSFSLEFSTYGSASFDGTGDYLSTSTSSNLQIGTGDFTIEYWIYPTNISATKMLLDRRVGSTSDMTMNINGSVDQKVRWYHGSGYGIISDSAITTNEWYHIALVRNSAATKMYINGVAQSTTYSDSNNYQGNGVAIAGSLTVSAPFQGYMSNYREVIGTAVYTSNFTKPTDALAAITNTKLLTANKNDEIVDSSSFAHTITKNGDATHHVSNPFPWNTTGYGSLYFDGTGDYLGVTGGTDFTFGTGAFTVECWYQPKFDTSGSDTIFLYDIGSEHVRITFKSGAIRAQLGSETQISYSISGSSLDQTTWHHSVLTRDGSGNVKLFHNGIVVGSYSSSTYNVGSTLLRIGDKHSGSKEFTGYISNFRAVKGSTVYTPTSLSGYSGSIYLNGGTLSSNGISGSYTMGTGDFTIETWFRYTGPSSLNSNDYLFDLGTSNDIRVTFGGGNINVDDGGQVFSYSANPIDTTKWYHLAYVRTGGISSLYLDGQLKASIGSSNYNHAESTFTLGNYGGGGNYKWQGYLTDFRIVKGKAVYTGNFTRPSGPLTTTGGTYPSSTNISNPTASQTVLLIGNNASSITDASNTGHTLTPSGSISASSDVPTGDSITVPTTPLTAVTNTKLLTAQRSTPLNVTSGSTYFDGSGDYIDTTNPLSGTGDFTMEGWVYPTTSGSYDGYFSTCLDTGANGGIVVAKDKFFVTHGGGSSLIGFSDTIENNVWCHIVLQRISNVFSLYKDGVLQGTATATVSLTGSTLRLGSRYNNNTTYLLTGYISNFRIVAGSTVYASSGFTPPNSALTAITNTQLLTCQNSTGSITDASSNSYTITANGNTTASTFVPTKIATDQSTSNHSITANGNTRNAMNWPFNYNG